MIFEERYSISAERAAREIMAEKSEKSKERKKRNKKFLNFFIVFLMLDIITNGI
jgi:hypothetical protein